MVDLSADRQASLPTGRRANCDENMFYVYAISSLNHKYIYVGLTQDIEARAKRHNDGRERTTRFYSPFEIIYSEVCETRMEARLKEKYWKSGIGKEKLKAMKNA